MRGRRGMERGDRVARSPTRQPALASFKIARAERILPDSFGRVKRDWWNGYEKKTATKKLLAPWWPFVTLLRTRGRC
jgi:hypothetical protein